MILSFWGWLRLRAILLDLAVHGQVSLIAAHQINHSRLTTRCPHATHAIDVGRHGLWHIIIDHQIHILKGESEELVGAK